MITFTQKGNLSKTEKFFERIKETFQISILDKYGKEGVLALSEATPKLTGKTASSWSYRIEHSKGEAVIYWENSNVNKGVNIALILQYGHGTQNGHYVKGIDYINPAMKTVFDKISDEAWKEITRA